MVPEAVLVFGEVRVDEKARFNLPMVRKNTLFSCAGCQCFNGKDAANGSAFKLASMGT